jgi:8-oxo-dGTP pyrophosphatase MutT (NUDIX family)
MSIIDQDEKIVPNRLKPKDAATLIMVRREAGQLPRVLMGRRHANMVFQPGKYVFPGGRIEPSDQRIVVPTALKPDVLEKLTRDASPARARGLALAAIRETFEEAGILLGEPARTLPRTRADAWRRFFAHGILPRLDVLNLVGRAITPPNRTRRFDARFFMADARAIGLTLDAAGSDELLEPCWLEFAEARALDLPSITRRMLDEVEARVMDGPGPARPIPFFRFIRGQSALNYL